LWSCHPIHERTLLRFQWVLQVCKSRSCSSELMNFRHLTYKRCDLDNLQQSVKWNYNHKQALPWTLKHKIQNTLKWVSVLRQFSMKMMFGEQNSMLWHSDQHTINYYHVMMIFFWRWQHPFKAWNLQSTIHDQKLFSRSKTFQDQYNHHKLNKL
jgi:hypothetical protein